MDTWIERPYMGYDCNELREIFQQMQAGKKWKGQVDAHVKAEDADKACVAVSYFAGGQAWAKPLKTKPGYCRVRAPGYWALIGA